MHKEKKRVEKKESPAPPRYATSALALHKPLTTNFLNFMNRIADSL
jgi:hypothetical protein